MSDKLVETPAVEVKVVEEPTAAPVSTETVIKETPETTVDAATESATEPVPAVEAAPAVVETAPAAITEEENSVEVTPVEEAKPVEAIKAVEETEPAEATPAEETKATEAVPEAEVAAAAPTVTEIPSVAEISAVTEVSAVAEISAVTEVPAVAEVSAVTEVPAATEVSAVTEVPAATEVPATAEVSAATEVPAVEVPAAAAVGAEAPTPTPEEPKITPIQALWAAAQENGHPEIWGVTLADPSTHVPSQIVFQKYLNANDGNFDKAKDQLLKTLEWRAKTKPLELLKQEFDSAKFTSLGYVTSYTAGETYDSAVPESKEVFTWNVYGNVSSMDKTFGNLQEFINWRVALMELALQELSLSTATKNITAEYDPYKIFQVHDYKSISFLRQSPLVKAASTETIKVFATSYPELLKEKFFVNVPAIMGFVYSFMKLFVAAKTIKKFHPMSNGSGLANELGSSQIKDLGKRLPNEYGGSAGELKTLGKETALKAAPAAEELKTVTKIEAKAPAEAKAE